MRPLFLVLLTLICPLALAEEEPSSPDELLVEARRRARAGDTVGVRIVAEEALEQPGDHQRTAQYLIALSLELEDRHTEALAIYDPLVEAYPRRRVPADLAVRRAASLAALDRHREAIRQLRAVGPLRTLAASDRVKVEVYRGTWDIERGRERRGLRRLDDVLSTTPLEVGSWWQAEARLLLMERALDQAAALPLDGSTDSPALARRAELLALAQEQLVALIELDQPRFGLGGFLALTRGYQALGHDLLSAGGEAVARPQVEGIWTKAVMLADRGEQLAARKAWVGEPAGELRAVRSDLERAIDRLP